jgi:hypothetical protein
MERADELLKLVANSKINTFKYEPEFVTSND